MGQLEIHANLRDEEGRRRFARALLDDLTALERMIAAGAFEVGVRRIGAEQELFLIDDSGRAVDVAQAVLAKLSDPCFTTELGQFNLEFNLPPDRFGPGFLERLEASLRTAISQVRAAARAEGADVLLVGVLPSLTLPDLGDERITQKARYVELNRAIMELAGGSVRTLISGIDDLQIEHSNVLLEACNTSFQIHWQTTPAKFAAEYNLAQVIAAPVLAAAANSPLLLQHRLWHETRIALFQQSLDFRSTSGRRRDTWQRVSFGGGWVDSVLDLYQEQVARYGLLVTTENEELSTTVLARGETPRLTALSLHNGTVYQWNRACYGITEGKPHLRIEHRPLPAGPTVLDEVANAALFFGLMSGLGARLGDVRNAFRFGDVKTNFQAAARYGLKASLHWTGGRVLPATALLLEELIPVAREGLAEAGVGASERDRYLDIIEDRVRTGRTGAQWQLDAFEHLEQAKSRVVRTELLVRAMSERERSGAPVHQWSVPEGVTSIDWRDLYRTVSQVMTTDLFTVGPDDLVDVAASVMRWKHVRHVPVEDGTGKLVGLLSYRSLLRFPSTGAVGPGARTSVPVREIMKPDPITTAPEARCDDAIALMREHGVSCLPVVHGGHLVGIVSERDFLELAYRLYRQHQDEITDQ